MSAPAVLRSIRKPEPGVDLHFYSPDEKRAERLAARLRSLATVHWMGSQGGVVASLPTSQNGSLILLDYSPDTAARSSELAGKLLAQTPDLPLVGVGSTGSDQATGVLAAMRAGVRDFLDLDATDEEIRHLLLYVQSQAGSSRPAPAPVAQRSRGRVILLLGVRPGVGTSTLAAHLGALMTPAQPSTLQEDSRSLTQQQVLLLDLGRPAGDAALYLGVESEFHYDDALRSARRIDPSMIRTALGRYASRLTVLSQMAGTLEPPQGGAELDVLVDRLRSHFELLLCDLGGLPVAQVPASLLGAADEIWLIVDQGIGSVVSLDAALRELERNGLRDQRLSLVINRYDEAGGVDAGQIAKRFNLPLLAVLPERSRTLRASANQGRLLHQVSLRDPYVRALDRLIEKLRTGPAPITRVSGWKRLLLRAGGFRWKSL